MYILPELPKNTYRYQCIWTVKEGKEWISWLVFYPLQTVTCWNEDRNWKTWNSISWILKGTATKGDMKIPGDLSVAWNASPTDRELLKLLKLFCHFFISVCPFHKQHNGFIYAIREHVEVLYSSFLRCTKPFSRTLSFLWMFTPFSICLVNDIVFFLAEWQIYRVVAT